MKPMLLISGYTKMWEKNLQGLLLPFSRGCGRGQRVHWAHKPFLDWMQTGARKQICRGKIKFRVNRDWRELKKMSDSSCSLYLFLYILL